MSTASFHQSGWLGRRPRASLTVVAQVFPLISLLALALGVLIPLAESHHALSYAMGGIAAAVTVGVLFNIPVRLLPRITLIVTLLVSTDVTFLPNALQGVGLGVVPLAVWMIRAHGSVRTPAELRMLALLLFVWLVLSEVFARIHTNRGWEWLVVAILAIIISVTGTPRGLRPREFRALFLTIATALGLYAVVEAFVLHRNVLFAPFFVHATWWPGLQNGGSYRATTLLGHPLFNGTIFATAAVLAASDLVEKRHRPRLASLRLMLLIGAVLATHSRGAAIALAVGLVVVVVFSRAGQRGIGARRLALVSASVIGAAVIIVGLQARNASREGQASAAVRVTVLARTTETLRGIEPFGAGPGESDRYRTSMQLPGSEIALENSYAELVVSLGPIGALLTIALVVAVVIRGIRSRLATGEAAALLTILVHMGGFNAIEGHSAILILIALFVVSTLTQAKMARQQLSPIISGERTFGRRV
jgi:O-antigen ligase